MHISEYNLFGLYNVNCICVFRDGFWKIKCNALPWGRGPFKCAKFPQWLIDLCVALRPMGFNKLVLAFFFCNILFWEAFFRSLDILHLPHDD